MMNIPFNEECLHEHNQLRNLHGCPPLKYDENLARLAQSQAQRLASCATLESRRDPTMGENIYMHTGLPSVTGKEAVHSWYREIGKHKFEEVGNDDTARFSQLIWRSTRRAGFGRASAHSYCSTFVVGFYQQPGNQKGLYMDNVPVRVDGKTLKDIGSAAYRRYADQIAG